MAISTAPTAELCRWVCSTQYEDLPAEVRAETVRVLYDQVGAMLASALLPSCRPVVELVRKLGPIGECSIIGHPLRTSVTNAALANGTIGHGDESDAAGQHGTGHYAATIVPAALSAGQLRGVPGKELCRAIALGSEVTARIQSTVGRGVKNVFAPSIGSTIGVAVCAGALLRLDAGQMEHAIGLAASAAAGLGCAHAEQMHQTKSLNHGRATEAGVFSALLAQDGFHGPREVLTIEHGFFDAFLGRPEAGHEVVKALGEDYLMRQIAYKRYPVGGPNQTPLYAFLQFIQTQKLAAEDIEQIEVSVSRNAYHTVTSNKHPSVHLETLLCLAAVYGEITFSHIHDHRYCEDPRVEAFRKRARISIVPRPGSSTMGQRLETVVTVRTRGGETLRQDLRYPLMSETEIQQKFRNLAGLRLTSDRVEDLERKLRSVENEQNVAPLVRELELPY